jgi:hypothetical protein
VHWSYLNPYVEWEIIISLFKYIPWHLWYPFSVLDDDFINLRYLIDFMFCVLGLALNVSVTWFLAFINLIYFFLTWIYLEQLYQNLIQILFQFWQKFQFMMSSIAIWCTCKGDPLDKMTNKSRKLFIQCDTINQQSMKEQLTNWVIQWLIKYIWLVLDL